MIDSTREGLECDCCGLLASGDVVSDGQPLACGCAGYISVDSESAPYVVVTDCDCGSAESGVRP